MIGRAYDLYKNLMLQLFSQVFDVTAVTPSKNAG